MGLSDTPYTQILTVALGIGAGLLWTRRTGWNCGGIITPGLLALSASEPLQGLIALGLGVALVPFLSLTSRLLGICGRERVGAAMLLSLGLETALACFVPLSPFRLGWVIPALIAADAERQGIVPTVCGAVSCALAASSAAALLAWLVQR
jgi:hypothetical protein